MAIALGATGWFMYIDIPETPRAVVVCVIIYNAFFGYRYVTTTLVVNSLENVHLFSWGPIPWLYPPEVFQDYFLRGPRNSHINNRSFPSPSVQRVSLSPLPRIGLSIFWLAKLRPSYKR